MLLAAGLAETARSGLVVPVPVVKLARDADGPWINKPVINGKLKPGKAKDFFVKIRNTTDHKQNARLELRGGDPSYRLRWFKGRRNITSEVRGGGFEFGLRPRPARVFRLRIKATAAPGEMCVGGQFHVMPDDVYRGGYFQINSASACD